MLQFNPTVYSITSKLTSRLLWRLHTSLMSNAATVSNIHVKLQEATSNIISSDVQPVAFNQLKAKLCTDFDTKSLIVSKIKDADDIHDLLHVIKEPLLTQTQILNALHTITSWVNENHNREQGIVPVDDVEQSNKHKKENIDLSRYQDFSTGQMIEEIQKLVSEGRRNVYVLNYLYQNIEMYSQELPPKVCSALMYSMAKLCYPNERLLKKLCSDLLFHMNIKPTNVSASTLASVLKSAGIVRYRNDTLLLHVTWDIIKFNGKNKYNVKQVAHILYTLGLLGYQSETLDRLIELYRKKWSCQTLGHNDWLDVVWSLCIFNKVEVSQITSVLNEEFVQKLMFHDAKRRLSYHLKLLNIDSYARCILKDYKGPSIIPKVIPFEVSKQTKQKMIIVQLLEETLKKLVPSSKHFKMSINTEMGFCLDAELHVDSNMAYVDLEKKVNKDTTKIGILLLDYHDKCLGNECELGLIKLQKQLLTSKNYRVICIPYTNFCTTDKVEKRLAYLKRRIWLTLNESV